MLYLLESQYFASHKNFRVLRAGVIKMTGLTGWRRRGDKNDGVFMRRTSRSTHLRITCRPRLRIFAKILDILQLTVG